MTSKIFTTKNLVIVGFILLFALNGATLYMLSQSKQSDNDGDDDKFATQMLYNEIDTAAQRQSLTPIPGTNRLYLADLNLTVPLSQTTSSVRYMYDGTNGGEIRLSSTYMTDHAEHVQSCSDMVRLKVEPKPNAYSPGQPHYASVTLSDGRTLQIYASKIKECQSAWQAMSPQTIAESFKAAVLY